VQSFALTPLSVSDFPTRHNYVLGLPQSRIEPILAGWVDELGVPVVRGCEVAGFVEDDGGVDVLLSDGRSLRAAFLVGCDGGRSLVRKLSGIDFAGLDPSTSWMIAEVEMDDEPEMGMRHDRLGSHGITRMEQGGPIRVLLTEPDLERQREPTIDDLRASLVAIFGTDYGLRRAGWISRFTDATRQAASYRRGRVLLAGDAAHVHPPHGGQGLNTGVQDAVNLGWKLAQVIAGASPVTLLDTYDAERHPVGAHVLQMTKALVALARVDERSQAVREMVGDFLTMDEPRRRVVGMQSGLDIRYDLGNGHPLVGRRMPDLDVVTAEGATRVFALLHDAKPLLLNFGHPPASSWASGVRSVDAGYDGPWELPVIGEVPGPPAVLIRPDGHVAWAGEPSDPALARAITTWFGAHAGDRFTEPRSG
jgi:2-polyprenyl-6-methoxyphenol hydroxylase-like FAD-dependent oxidoreductase